MVDLLLPLHIIGHIANFAPPNELATTWRLVSKELAELLRSHVHVRLSQPVAHSAFIWRWCSPAAMRVLSLRHRVQLLYLTATSGCLENLIAALEAADWDPVASWEFNRFTITSPTPLLGISIYNLLAAAAAAGHLHICQWLRQRGCPWGSSLLVAAESGQETVCEWLLSNGCPCDPRAATYAALGGHMALARWFLKHRPLQVHTSVVGYFLEAVAYGCDLASLQEVYREVIAVQLAVGQQHIQPFTDWQRVNIMAAAAGSPTADFHAKLDWLETLGYPRTEKACCMAARCRDAADRLAWLRQRGYRTVQLAVREAASCGNLTALEYLLAEAPGIAKDSGEAAKDAASKGHLAALKVLHAQGWVINQSGLILEAVRGGHLAVVVWLVEVVGVTLPSLDSELLNAAAASGNMELVVWLRGQGCLGVLSTIVAHAARGGCGAVLEWLVKQGCPMPDDGQPYVDAAHAGDLATLRCLRRLGCPWGPGSEILWDCYMSGAPPAALRWLMSEGCEVKRDWTVDRDTAHVSELRADDRQRDVLLTKVWKRQQQRQGQGVQYQQHEEQRQQGGVSCLRCCIQ